MKKFNPLPATAYDIVARMKSEILEDIASGRVPSSVRRFGDLDDFVDANCYGGFCEDDEPVGICNLNKLVGHTRATGFVDLCQKAVDRWLVTCRPRFRPLDAVVHGMGLYKTHPDDVAAFFIVDDFGTAVRADLHSAEWAFSCASNL